MDEQGENEFLTVEEAAKILHISTKKLRQWSKPGPSRVFHPIRLEKIPSRLKFRRVELEKFIDEHTVNRPPEENET